MIVATNQRCEGSDCGVSDTRGYRCGAEGLLCTQCKPHWKEAGAHTVRPHCSLFTRETVVKHTNNQYITLQCIMHNTQVYTLDRVQPQVPFLSGFPPA